MCDQKILFVFKTIHIFQPGYGPMSMMGPQQQYGHVGSSDGSPVHQYHHPQGYGQPSMGLQQPQMYNQSNAQPGYSQAGGQYPPPVTSQTGPQFQQGPYPQQPISSQPSNLPGTYDSQGGYQSSGQYSQMPPSTMAQGMPPSTVGQSGMQPQQGAPQSQGVPMSQGYQPVPSSNMDYQAFNMQGK